MPAKCPQTGTSGAIGRLWGLNAIASYLIANSQHICGQFMRKRNHPADEGVCSTSN